jgi:3-phenylpropionate/trans-cinnamate dioxygenase ferredoxin reductase subunit
VLRDGTGGAERIRVGAKMERDPLAPAGDRTPAGAAVAVPNGMVIVGAGAAGAAAAEMLRREGFDGRITVLDAEEGSPYDRPNLSKDYLAGNAPEEWIPLRPPGFYADHAIDVLHHSPVAALDARARTVRLADGRTLAFDRLLLATGAAPIRLPIPGADLPHVCTLRSLADSRALIARLGGARRAVVIGASFIGLEVAASLRARGLEVRVVAPESRLFARVLGEALGDAIQAIHVAHGVVFHLGNTVKTITRRDVTLESGERYESDLVVMGVGVRPNTALAESAGLATDRGVLVNEQLETSAPGGGIFAAGDIARYPDPRTGERARIEHWVHAERMGQTAARNMLGAAERFTEVPFFWSQHYDMTVSYVGHAETWDETRIDGDPAARDVGVLYLRGGKALAVATVGRDRESLRAEAELEGRA